MSLQRKTGEAGHSAVVLAGAVALGMVVAIYLGQTIGYGEWKKTYLVLLLLGFFPALLAAGGNYWLILPFAMTVSLPAIPIVPGRSVSLGELAAVAAVVAMGLRMPLGGQTLRWLRAGYVPVLLYVLWAAFIYKMNGSGLAIFGASTVGARSYLKIGLAFVVFIVICNQRIEDRHCRTIVYSLLVAAICSTAWNVFEYFIKDATAEQIVDGFYSWHQNLALLPMFFLPFAFAKHSLPTLVREMRIGWMSAIVLCYGLAAFSGKRAVFAACLIFPLVSIFFRKQYLLLVSCLVGVAGLLTVLVAGHGKAFELPLTVQRVLWVLPGDWDTEVRMSTLGSFRRTLNKLAKEQIAENPIVGRGFGFAPVEAKLAMDPRLLQRRAERGDHLGAYVMAVGGQWHSTWLGISAALGIPGAVLWGVIWAQMIAVGTFVVRRAPPESYAYLLAVMILMLTVIGLCRSMTSGHAAENLWASSWSLAVLLVLKWQILEEKLPERVSRRPPANLPMTPMGAPGGGIPDGPREALARRLK